MGDKLRLMVTGVAAVGAIGLTVASGDIWSAINQSEGPYHQVPLAQLKDFEGITLQGPDNVIVTPGPNFSVRTEGDAQSVRYLTAEVERGVLKIGRQKRNGWWGAGGSPVTVHVTMPGLTRVWISGSGDITADKMEVKDFRARLDGSGGLRIAQLTSNDVQLTLNGSGNMDLSGTARDININLVGSGSVMTHGLKAQSADISVAGSGEVHAHADRNAKLTLRGSGHAQVDGTTRCQIEKNGSGEAECKT
jgi:hypothetical protein